MNHSASLPAKYRQKLCQCVDLGCLSMLQPSVLPVLVRIRKLLVLDLARSTVCSPIFTALWHWGARILRNFDLLTLARARTGHNMSPATAPCARAPGGAMRAPGSRSIFTVLAISAMRGPQNGWLGASHFSEFMHAFRAACMHSGLPACM